MHFNMLNLPSFLQDLYVAHIYSSHEEQNMNENMKRKKKMQAHGNTPTYLLCAFYALSLLPPLDV